MEWKINRLTQHGGKKDERTKGLWTEYPSSNSEIDSSLFDLFLRMFQRSGMLGM